MTTIDGPFKREGAKIVDANGLRLATMATSLRVTSEELDKAGDLLAASWELRELLRHTLTCSGSPTDCETCAAALRSVEK